MSNTNFALRNQQLNLAKAEPCVLCHLPAGTVEINLTLLFER
ncbi:hypothetical protein [Methyloglobulus sp.]